MACCKGFGMMSLAVVAMVMLLPNAFAVDYCNLSSCSGRSHTMCAYTQVPGPECRNYTPAPLSDGEKYELLKRHNELRSQIAEGRLAGFASASNMEEMYWDHELAKIAQRWADQCKFAHDQCRNLETTYAGQNIAWYMTTATNFPSLLDRVMDWWNEYKKYTYSSGPYQFSMETGHFTAMAWSGTNRLGCGRSHYKNGDWNIEFLVCNYAPGGNMGGQPLYKEGRPCDGCNCSPRYGGLCA